MSAARGAILATITISVVIGLVEYHHVLDPSTAQRDGFTMNLLVDSGNGQVPNDWYTAGGAHVAVRGGAVRIVARADGYALESRIVHLSAHACYSVLVRGAATRGVAVLAAYDAELSRFSSYAPIPRSAGQARFLVSARDQRVTLTVAATAGAHVTLQRVRFRRLSRSCTTPRTGRDIGLVLTRLLRS